MRKISLLLTGATFGAAAGVRRHPGDAVPARRAPSPPRRRPTAAQPFRRRVRAHPRDYVEPPDDAKLVEAAINGMLQSLDPHSTYLTPKSQRDMSIDISGEFGGQASRCRRTTPRSSGVRPMEDTPASRAGLQPSDVIERLDGEHRGLVAEAVRRQDARAGEHADRADHPSWEHRRSVRRSAGPAGQIKVKSVRYRAEDDVAYIRSHSSPTRPGPGCDAIAKAQKEIGDSKLKGYVIDLRNNPGSLLDEAVEVADDFLDRGEIVSTRGRDPNRTERHTARPGDLSNGKPVIVLINGLHRSSEIVAGAREISVAPILGTRSFGKGSVERSSISAPTVP